MYTPSAFAETRLPVLHDAIERIGFAALVTHGASGLEATHLPMILVRDEGPLGTLYGHVARANTHAKPPEGDALVMFSGPHAYISPNGYPGKAAHGKEVPTWNYVAVHAYGRPHAFDDADTLLILLRRLTAKHEGQTQPRPWSVDDAPGDYIQRMVRAIVGLRIPLDRVEGKWKVSQNRTAEDRLGAAALLAERPGDDEQAIAAEMRAIP
ncbi:transcriptional regulator [Luteibacter sp. Sphag1AF]|uniref:FMN-binding negative transcriptional regulator n=1 Tax=Luteibacter sp. Sphag1AF TaxID=2587031 RepID=UPI00160CA04C|nr:FMN-binding negative transcriptional regulator [Luteibacter sp. Sphag1AF]MBB3226935.1 transcriptional regulator [Luteibacter sp. Sphag1AF]